MPTKKIAQKIFVLDTNVILNNANSIFHYPNAEIIIPLCVINKDDFKKLLNSVGKLDFFRRVPKTKSIQSFFKKF